MSKKGNTPTPMTPKSASRIQSHADRTSTNQGFKSRSQSSGAKNAGSDGSGGSGSQGGGQGGGQKK